MPRSPRARTHEPAGYVTTPGGGTVDVYITHGCAQHGPDCDGKGMHVGSDAVWVRFGDGPWVRSRERSAHKTRARLGDVIDVQAWAPR